MESDAIWIHADESCLGNQYQDRASPGGAAALVERWDGSAWVRRDYWVSEPATTNNRMALRSAIEALSQLERIGSDDASGSRDAMLRPLEGGALIRFVSDSQYLVKGMSEWLPGWKARGWKRKAGPIENLDLWKELDGVAAGRTVRWEWVRGHAGHPRNEYANDLAVRAATEQDASGGLVESGFAAWLAAQRQKGRYSDFKENAGH